MPGGSAATRVLQSALLIVIALYGILFLIVAFIRIGYPFELEWIEGGSLQHVQRVREGLPLYTKPSLEWTPLLYTPFYYLVSAVAAALFGDGFAPLRAVSILSTVGTVGLLAWMLKRETGSWIAGFVAGGFWVAGFRTVGSWLDVARVDPLFILLLTATVALLRFGGGVRTAVLAGICAWLAYLSKQTTIGILVPVVVWILLTQRRRGLAFFATAFMTIAGTVLSWNAASDGWYQYYTMDLPPRHPMETRYWIEFWTTDLLMRAPIAILFAAFFIVWLIRQAHGSTARRILQGALHSPRSVYVVLAMGCLAGSWASRLHGGGWFNVLMPAYLAISIGFALGYDALGHTFARTKWRNAITGAALVQFVLVAYNPFQELPSKADRATGERVIDTLSRAPGDVWVPEHPYLAERAGKGTSAHAAALLDVLRIPGAESDSFRVQLFREIRDRNFVAAALHNSAFVDVISDDFVRAPDLIRDETFWPVVGVKIRPSFLFVKDEDIEDQRAEAGNPAGLPLSNQRGSAGQNGPRGPSPFYRGVQ